MKDDQQLRGTVTLVIVTLDLDPPAENSELSMQQLRDILSAGLAFGDDAAIENESQDSVALPAAQRVLH